MLFTAPPQTADATSFLVSEAGRPVSRRGQAEPPLLCLLALAGRPSSLLGAPACRHAAPVSASHRAPPELCVSSSLENASHTGPRPLFRGCGSL